jgi:3-isopropylmalate/(R)-2-methylmalate dehydratase large subunit
MGIDQTNSNFGTGGRSWENFFEKALNYMGFRPGENYSAKTNDYVFLGSCTNGRIEDFRTFAQFVKGKKNADNVVAWLVPGSRKWKTNSR